jgi:hypothetical protein
VAEDGPLGYGADRGIYPFGWAAADICINFHSDEPLAGAVRRVCELALGGFQDVVGKTTTEPGPGARQHVSAPSAES